MRGKEELEKKKELTWIEWLIIIGVSAITVLAVMGIASLAFFFVKEFCLTYGLGMMLTYIGSAIVSSIIFATYITLFTVTTFKDLKNLFLSEKTEQKENEMSVKWEDITVKQKVAQVLSVANGIIAIIFLGGGAYLGMMTVGEAIGATALFFPWAIISSACLFFAMFWYFRGDLVKNATRLSQDTPPPQPQPANAPAAKNELTSWSAILTRWGYRMMAAGASIGFGTFKLYSTIHVVRMIGITADLPVAIISGIALFSMTVMTATTSGVRIWDVGEKKAADIENGVTYEQTPIAKPGMKVVVVKESNALRYFAARGFTELSAIFNAVASYMGMSTLSGAICTLFPAAAVVITPLFVVLGIAVAACRYMDFVKYYGPRMNEHFDAEHYSKTKTIHVPIAKPKKPEKAFNPFAKKPEPKDDFMFREQYADLFAKGCKFEATDDIHRPFVPVI